MILLSFFTYIVLAVLLASPIDASSVCKPGQRRPVVGICQEYQECSTDGQNWMKRNCSPSESYDPEAQQCRFAWKVNCVNAPIACSKDGDKTVVPGDSNSFFECSNGAYHKRSCGMLMRFDQESSNCQFWYNVNNKENPKCSGSVKIPVDDKCQQYRICIGGAYRLRKCDEGEFLDTNTNECQKGTGDCSAIKQCLEEFPRPVQGDSSSYVQCTDGKDEIHQCPHLHRFDAVDLTCKWLWNIHSFDTIMLMRSNPCKNDLNPQGIPNDCFHYTECHSGRNVTQTCPKIGKVQLKFDCENRICTNPETAKCCAPAPGQQCSDNEIKGDPSDCRVYYECKNGSWDQNKCSIIYHFDCKSKTCAFRDYTCCK